MKKNKKIRESQEKLGNLRETGEKIKVGLVQGFGSFLKIHSQFSDFSVNFSRWIPTDAAPTGLSFVRWRFSTEIPSLRDSRGFWSLEGFCVKSSSVRNADRMNQRRVRVWHSAGRVRRKTEPTGLGLRDVFFTTKSAFLGGNTFRTSIKCAVNICSSAP